MGHVITKAMVGRLSGNPNVPDHFLSRQPFRGNFDLSTGLVRRAFSSSSVGSSMITAGGLGFLTATFILTVRPSGAGAGTEASFVNFRLFKGVGGESLSSSLPDSTTNAALFLGEGA